MSLADAMGLAQIFQGRLFAHESNFSFLTAPGTNDLHVQSLLPILRAVSKNYAITKGM